MKAFTLIEVLVVIVILAILAVLIMPRYVNRRPQVHAAQAQADLQLLRSALHTVWFDTGLYPDTLPDLCKSGMPAHGLTSAGVPADFTSWNGPYIQNWPPSEPNGGAWIYTTSGSATGTLVDSFNTSW